MAFFRSSAPCSFTNDTAPLTNLSTSAFVSGDVDFGQPSTGSNSSKRGAARFSCCCGGGGGGGFAITARSRALAAAACSSLRFSASMSSTKLARSVSYTACAWEGNEVGSNRLLVANVRKKADHGQAILVPN